MSVFIDIHTHHPTTGSVSIYSLPIGGDVTHPEPETPFSAGIHPWSASATNTSAALEYLNTVPLTAIGEIGLDYASKTDRTKQVEIFEAQLTIAEKRGMPVIIHCVRAHNDVMRILGKYKLKAVIFHGYTGSPQLTATICRAGYYLSFGERSLGSAKTMESLRSIPHDRIFAETDDSDVNISWIYARLADQLDMTVDRLKTRIECNFKDIFGWTP